MIKILTETKKEYMEIKKLLSGKKLDVSIHSPEDSIAMVVWSIDDLKSEATFPIGTPDDVIYAAMEKVEDTLKDDMTARGWETIDTLKNELLSEVHSIMHYSCYNCGEKSTAEEWDKATVAKLGNNIDTVEDTVLKGLNDITNERYHICPKCGEECYLTKNSEVKVYCNSLQDDEGGI